MRRLAVVAVGALAALAACSSSTPASLPTPSPVEDNVSPSPSVHGRPHYALLPRSCTKADGVHVVSGAADGATGHYLNWWQIESRTPCTLNGRPQVALFEADGQRAVTHRTRFFEPGGRAHPVAIGPRRSVRVAISTYRCDVTRDPPRLTTARFDFASSDVVVTAALKLPTPYCPKELREDVGVASIGSQERKPLGAYAVNMRSLFDPGKHPTWGSADLDGDGKPDTVVLRSTPIVRGRPFARMTVDLSSKAGTIDRKVQLDGPIRLQALSDLNGDGRAEILVGYPSDPVGSGYYNGETDSVVFTVVRGHLRMVTSAKPFMLSFSVLRAEQESGVVCHGNELTQVLVQGDKPRSRIVRTTYRLKGAQPLLVDESTTTSRKDAAGLLPLTQSRCPGMGTDGWAASD